MKEMSKTFKLKYRADFVGNERDNVVSIWIAKPVNSNTQHVEKFLISKKPTKQYSDKNGNVILYFELKNETKYFIEFYLEVTLKKQLDKIQINLDQCFDRKSTQNKSFIKSEKYLQQSDDLRSLAQKISGEEKSGEKIIEKIFKFVMRNFSYKYPVKNRGVENMDFKKLEGDCAEYASFFVALNRSLKIPSQNRTGFVVFPENNKIVEHGWASVCCGDNGWLDFDPQYASLEKDWKKYFAKTSDYRIVFTKNFNIPLKFYRDAEGIEIIKMSAQTLQPIAFISKNKIRFKHKIQII